MDLDLSSLWSWTIPLWGLFVLVLFLGGVLTQETVLEGLPLPAMVGGRRTKKSVRFASDV
jgi:hypothetical protein